MPLHLVIPIYRGEHLPDVSIGIHGIKSIPRTHVHHFMCRFGDVDVQLARFGVPVIVMDVKCAEGIGFGNKS